MAEGRQGSPAREDEGIVPERQAAPAVYLGSGLGSLQPFLEGKVYPWLVTHPRILARRLKTSVLNDALDLFRPLGTRLAEEGAGAGKPLMDALRRAGDLGEVMAGKRLVHLVDANLGKLSKQQSFELLDLMEGRKASTSDAAVQRAFDVARSLTDDIAMEAEDLEVTISTSKGRVPFTRQANYFPHIIRGTEALKSGPIRKDVIENVVRTGAAKNAADAAQLLDEYVAFVDGGGRQARLLQHLVDSGQAKDQAEAFAKLGRMRQQQHVNRNGNIEFAREVNLPFYDPDPRRVLPQHVAGASIRLAQVAELGQENQAVKRYVKQIADAGGNADWARAAVDKIIGFANKADSKDAKVGRFLRSIQGFKLGLAAIPNSTQGVLNGMLGADLPSLARGLRAATRKHGWRFAIESGATIDPILHESVKDLAGSSRTLDIYLRATGFQATERWNRVLAANTGAAYAERMIEKAKRGNKRAAAALEELGINAASAVRRGKLDPDEVLLAAKKFTDMTQFRSRPEDMPEFASSEWGKVFWQFKNFSYQATRLFYRSLVGELQAGNFGRAARNLLILSTIYPLTGAAVNAIRNLLKGREEEDEGLQLYLKSAAAAGALGIVYDSLQSAGRGKVLEFLAGPTVSDVAKLGQIAAADDDAEDKAEKLGKFVIQRAPGGTILERMLAE